MLDNIDKYINDNMNTVIVPPVFSPHIIPVYPPHNELIFEEWVSNVYVGCNSDRLYLPVFWTSYYVNNDYGKDAESLKRLHFFLSELDKTKKYFTICQYDDGTMIDWEIFGLDVLEFNMSKKKGGVLPLLCQPHPYKFKGGKKWLANFIGSKTHEIRNSAEFIKNRNGYYISYENHDIETYCRILHESIFTLCYRGYGENSFRISEAIQFGSIPVYISTGNDFILPSWIDFGSFGVVILEKEAYRIHEILESIEPETIVEKQNALSEAYENFYSYEANLKHIIKYLEAEYNLRKQG
jgi:hypothetical protein